MPQSSTQRAALRISGFAIHRDLMRSILHGDLSAAEEKETRSTLFA
ncbi:MAG TPA: hypothetical protein VLD67_20035 [Vicinamibacterales bacterium]|jgi:hypothetical protein|nr:hypothetical protein [Vicinamibacterales bacterium]